MPSALAPAVTLKPKASNSTWVSITGGANIVEQKETTDGNQVKEAAQRSDLLAVTSKNDYYDYNQNRALEGVGYEHA